MERIELCAGRCPGCGKRRTIHLRRMEDGRSEARVQCWRCGTDEVHTAASMDVFVIAADVQQHGEPEDGDTEEE